MQLSIGQDNAAVSQTQSEWEPVRGGQKKAEKLRKWVVTLAQKPHQNQNLVYKTVRVTHRSPSVMHFVSAE